jgi:hypothetical protein
MTRRYTWSCEWSGTGCVVSLGVVMGIRGPVFTSIPVALRKSLLTQCNMA